MARRFRIIQYDGPESWIVKLFDRSLSGLFYISPYDAKIMAWEASEGDLVIGRDNVPAYSGERFADLDRDPNERAKSPKWVPDRPYGFYDLSGISHCGECGGDLSGSAMPSTCRRSVGKTPIGGKSK